MAKQVVDGTTEAGRAHRIQPQHINTKVHFWEGFGNNETEISARLIVQLCQKKGGWLPFTKEEIDAFSKENFYFNHLRDRDGNEEHSFVRLCEDGLYRVTHEFIAHCYRSSPAAL